MARERWTYEELCELHRARNKPSYEAFAEWLEVGPRSVQRWLTEPDKRPNLAISDHLDDKLRQAVNERICWLPADQVKHMNRRDLLRLLSAAATISAGEGNPVWNARLPRITDTCLGSLEDVTTILAGKYNTNPAHTLLGAATGHLEEACRLLRTGIMQPSQRQRLESIVADTATFVGVLSMQAGKPAQADAHLALAEKMARQSENMMLLAQVLAEQALLDYYTLVPDQANNDPRPRVALLEQAQALATSHAPAIVQMAISGWLAEDKAVAKDAYGADEALALSAQSFHKAQAESLAGKGFCSSAGGYSGWGEAKLEGFRGAVELALNRSSVVKTMETSLLLTTNLCGRATRLPYLAKALIMRKQPEGACARLTEAHTIGLSQSSATVLHHVVSARMLMPPEWDPLRCVRELDERLRVG